MSTRNIIRALPLFFNGKKIAAVSRGTYDINSGAELALGAVDGYLGHMSGWPTVKISPTVIVPVIGMQAAVDDFLFDETPLAIGLPANGHFHQVTVRIVGISYHWDWKTGAVTGDLTFEGGKPELIGSTVQLPP